jgi:hypothetical protein
MPAVITHPGNDYYVNAVTGTIQRQSNAALAAGLHAAGFLGPYTWAEAKGIAAGIGATGANNPGGAGATPTPTTLGNPLSGIAAVGDFFQRLTQGATWIRVGEVLLGVALIIVGIAKLAIDTPAGKAALAIGSKAALL